jgi:hypothetical protein
MSWNGSNENFISSLAPGDFVEVRGLELLLPLSPGKNSFFFSNYLCVGWILIGR